MSEKNAEGREMTTAPLDEMHDLVRRAAGPHAPWKIRVRRAAHTLGLPFSRAKDFYYRNPKARVWPEELDAARRVASEHKLPGAASDDNGIEELRTLVAQMDAVADRLERLGIGKDADRARRVSGRLRSLADGDRE